MTATTENSGSMPEPEIPPTWSHIGIRGPHYEFGSAHRSSRSKTAWSELKRKFVSLAEIVKGASSLLLRRGHIVAVMSVRSDWFGVRVVVEIQVADEPPGTRKYEDRVIVVRASSEARRKAERVTRRDGESYRNVKGERVVRRFKECDCPPRDLGKIPVAQLKRYPTTLERIFGRAG